MDMEEKLIMLVQKYECLYNVSCRKYNDKRTKEKAWRIISNEIGMSADECLVRWRRLRENYSKAVKSRENKSGAAALRPYKYEKELAFIKPHLRDKTKFPQKNTTHDSSSHFESTGNSMDDEDFQTGDVESSSEASAKPASNVSEMLQFLIESNKEKHPVDAFFSAMAANVKKLPLRLQLEVKNKVFSAVSEAELKNLNESADFNTHKDHRSQFALPCETVPQFAISSYSTIKSEKDDEDSESD